MIKNNLYLDLDGVIADFNSGASELMDGMRPEDFEETRGTTEFWKRINSKKDFFASLKPLEDGLKLWFYTTGLQPIILTGIPRGMDPHYNQKVRWVNHYLGSNQPVICCLAKEKSKYCVPGDILIDDRTVYKHLWEEAGGHYIVHTSFEDSIAQLDKIIGDNRHKYKSKV